MRSLDRLVCLCAMSFASLGCSPASLVGLPPDSPFHEPVVLAADLLPQGIAVGEVTAHGALLWVRTEGPAMVQVEWAPPSVWETASKMATAVAPVARTARLETRAETDYTLAIPLEGAMPGTRYRYHVLVGRAADAKNHVEARLAARGEFTTLPDVKSSVPVTFAWSGDLGGQERCRRGPRGYPIFDVLRKQSPDFFLFLGDTIYADDTCPSPPNEPGADFKAATLAEYRARHRYQRGAEALRQFLEAVPIYVIWDDHEVRNNFAGEGKGVGSLLCYSDHNRSLRWNLDGSPPEGVLGVEHLMPDSRYGTRAEWLRRPIGWLPGTDGQTRERRPISRRSGSRGGAGR